MHIAIIYACNFDLSAYFVTKKYILIVIIIKRVKGGGGHQTIYFGSFDFKLTLQNTFSPGYPALQPPSFLFARARFARINKELRPLVLGRASV